MRPQLDSGIPDVLGTEDLTEVTPDAIDKILAASPLAAHIGFAAAEKFAAASADVNKRFAERFHVAQTATAKNPPAEHLEKSARTKKLVAGDANDTRKVIKTDVTRYSDGDVLEAEIAESGEVIRVWQLRAATA